MSDIAQDIIEEYGREKTKVEGYWNSLWQDVADLVYPFEDQIITRTSPGEDKSIKRYDDTAVQDLQEAAAGLSASTIPRGQKFFELMPEDDMLGEIDAVRRYLSMATSALHREIYKSNFMMHFNENVSELMAFGTSCMFSEWDDKNWKLNFKDIPISRYLIKEDSHGVVDTVMWKTNYSARQALSEFGAKEVSDEILKAADKMETESKRFPFIYIVRPRNDRNPLFKDAKNMRWQSLYVDVTAKTTLREQGFMEMPFAVARWRKNSAEKYGRGLGTDYISTIRMLQQMRKDYLDSANRQGKPPYQILDGGFEGPLNLLPNGVNMVSSVNAITPINPGILGNHIVTEESLKMQIEEVHRLFFRDVFIWVSDLTQRMTTVEVSARRQESLQRLTQPVSRLHSEQLTPIIRRAFNLCVEYGRIPKPPPQLALRIEYTGPLALALRNQEANGFMQTASVVAQLAQIYPAAIDMLNMDGGIRRIAESNGMNVNDINSEEAIAGIRVERAKQQQMQAALQAAQVAGDTYNKGTKAPEPGSASSQLMEAANAR